MNIVCHGAHAIVVFFNRFNHGNYTWEGFMVNVVHSLHEAEPWSGYVEVNIE